MINKRLLIKNLLSHHDENSFYDKKRQLNLHTIEGKAKFLKHICALSNANPANNSYIVVGVEGETNEIRGVDFFDDSNIQNLVNAYLHNPPKIQYENILFPNLPIDKVVGLVTIKPKSGVSSFKKAIHTVFPNSIFVRKGSNSIPTSDKIQYSKSNVATVISIQNSARNNIKHTLESVLEFINVKHNTLNTHFEVFKELFVVCWAGNKKTIKDKTYYSRVDIELINEQVKLFYSDYDEVMIDYDANSFTITEFVKLGLNDATSYYPFEKVTFTFYDNGFYQVNNSFLFEPPQYNIKMLHHVFNSTLKTLEKLKKGQKLSDSNHKEVENSPSVLMICYLNNIKDAKDQLLLAKEALKAYKNPKVYTSFKEVLRILRKMKYESSTEK